MIWIKQLRFTPAHPRGRSTSSSGAMPMTYRCATCGETHEGHTGPWVIGGRISTSMCPKPSARVALSRRQTRAQLTSAISSYGVSF